VRGRYRRQAYIVATTIAIVIGVAVIIDAYVGDRGDGSGARVERTCEIVRDIAADAAAGVDTEGRTRDRLEHLLDGYGVDAPADIQTPLRDAVAATTDVVLELLRAARVRVFFARALRPALEASRRGSSCNARDQPDP
jgi:hypothetical protein